MKVTVSFSDTKVVVPCGDGSLLIRELAEMAICRYRKSVGSTLKTTTKSSSGISDDEVGDSMSGVTNRMFGGSFWRDTVFLHAIGEVEAMVCRRRNPSSLILALDSLTLARDGGILDWDDQVSDVLDDREMLLARYKWDTPTTRTSNANTVSMDNLVRQTSKQAGGNKQALRIDPPTSAMTNERGGWIQNVPCNGDLDNSMEGDVDSFMKSIYSKQASPPHEIPRCTESMIPPLRTNAPLPPTFSRQTPSPNWDRSAPAGDTRTSTATSSDTKPVVIKSAFNEVGGNSTPSRTPIPPSLPPNGINRAETLVAPATSSPPTSFTAPLPSDISALLSANSTGTIRRPAPPPPPLSTALVNRIYNTSEDEISILESTMTSVTQLSPLEFTAIQHKSGLKCASLNSNRPISATATDPMAVTHSVSSCTSLRTSSAVTTNSNKLPDEGNTYSFVTPSPCPPGFRVKLDGGFVLADELSRIPEEDCDSQTTSNDFDSSRFGTLESTGSGIRPISSQTSTVVLPSPVGSSKSATSTTLPLSSSHLTAPSSLRSSPVLLSSTSSDGEEEECEEWEPELESGVPFNIVTSTISSSYPGSTCKGVMGGGMLKQVHQFHKISSLLKSSRFDKGRDAGSRGQGKERVKAASERSHKLGRRRFLQRALKPSKPVGMTSPTPVTKITTNTSMKKAPPPQPPIIPMPPIPAEVPTSLPLGSKGSEDFEKQRSRNISTPSHFTDKRSPSSSRKLKTEGEEESILETEYPSVWKLREPLIPQRSTLVSMPSLLSTTSSDLTSARTWYLEIGSELESKASSVSRVDDQFQKEDVKSSKLAPATSSLAPTTPMTSGMEVGNASSLDISVSLLSIGHPAPPPPPKRSPQTVLTGKLGEKLSDPSSPTPTPAAVKLAPPPPPVPMVGVSQHQPLVAMPQHVVTDDDNEQNDNEVAHEMAHMAGLLSRRRASETLREFLLTTAEAEHERERRLQAAAVNVVAFRRRNPVAPAIQSHPLYEVYGAGKFLGNDQPSAFSKVLPAEEEITIKLLKAAAGLGFSLTTREMFLGAFSTSNASPSKTPTNSVKSGGIASPQTLHRQVLTPVYGRAVCVKSIIPGGAALKDGILRLGDRLMKVDREDISTKSQAQIVSLLRVKPVGSEVELIVRRPRWVTANNVNKSTPLTSIADGETTRRILLQTADNTNSCESYRILDRCPCMSPNCTANDYHRPVQTCRLGSMDDSHLTNNPERFEKVILLKLDIPLLGPGAPSEASEGSRNRLATMRLGVSVREGGAYEYNHSTVSSIRRQVNSTQDNPQLSQGTQWNNALPSHSPSFPSSTSGVFVKGIIEGGAAHADGRLRMEDEILEVNGVNLTGIVNPLAMLRAVLKQAASQAAAMSSSSTSSLVGVVGGGEETIGDTSTTASLKQPDVGFVGKKNLEHPHSSPLIRLLIARRIRHRRSASGHTIGSNFDPLSPNDPLMFERQIDSGHHLQLEPSSTSSSSSVPPPTTSHAVCIAADVHSSTFVAMETTARGESPGETRIKRLAPSFPMQHKRGSGNGGADQHLRNLKKFNESKS